MFAHLVTTRLARDILERFLVDGTVSCKDDDSKAHHALEAAYVDAVAHACLRSDAPPNESKTLEPESKYRWSWRDFPTTPINENRLVAFLNTIADKALSTAKSILGGDSLKPRNRGHAPGLYGCIEFICIVVGIVLSEKEEFGHNPDVEIDERDICVDVPELPSADTPHSGSYFTNSDFTSQSAVRLGFNRSASSLGTSYSVSSDLPSADQSSAISSATFRSRIASTGSKRGPDDEMGGWKELKKTKRTVTIRAIIPVRVYGLECIGILFSSGSAWGRGTTVYTVVAADDGKTHLALKTSWQDVARTNDQIAVLKRLHGRELHPNIVIPSQCVFLWLLNKTYFWSPHDFVRGVIGALLGHRYLCEIGILHRDISENNIVLSLYQGGLGALIDFDMATVDCPSMHLDSPPPPRLSREEILASLVQPDSPLLADDKAERVGTTPYISVGVLDGYPHTHYDDIESIFYVLVLFFFSYQGPLEKEALRSAEVQGFTQSVGEGRLPHVTAWPDMFKQWATGSLRMMSCRKYGDLKASERHATFVRQWYPHIRSRWEPGSQSTAPAIACLIQECRAMFFRHELKVAHGQFVEVLQEWLKRYASDESNYDYPFDD
ncbi:hypothetical protein F5141DRAFT_1219855 [Pisolithus sp. B1]|nr:hypothetical protein F5141DRAFT_1219855 [Pisolithus sp. B1]